MGPKSSTKKKSPTPPKTIFDLAHVLSHHDDSTFGAFALTGKHLIDPVNLDRLKTLYYSKAQGMKIDHLKEESDRLYLSMSPQELKIRFEYLKGGNFPAELLISITNDSYLARGFFLMWSRGGEMHKPTNIMNNDLSINIDNFDHWKEKNERRFYESIYTALKMPHQPAPAGGKSRRVRKNKKRRSIKNAPTIMYRGGEDPPATAVATEPASYFFETKNISTQPNIDPDYEEVGIIHITDTLGVNAIREGATSVFNFFGQKGFDNSRYDVVRNEVLKLMVEEMAKQNIDRVCNVRMDASPGTDYNSMIIANIYGTALRKKGGSSSSTGSMSEMSKEQEQQEESVQEQEQEQEEEQEQEKKNEEPSNKLQPSPAK